MTQWILTADGEPYVAAVTGIRGVVVCHDEDTMWAMRDWVNGTFHLHDELHLSVTDNRDLGPSLLERGVNACFVVVSVDADRGPKMHVQPVGKP